MRYEKGPTVDSRCGVLWIPRFTVTCYPVRRVVGGRGHVGCYDPSHRNKACVVVRTWCNGGMRSAGWDRIRNRSMRVVSRGKRFEGSYNPGSNSFPFHTVGAVLFFLTIFFTRKDSRKSASDQAGPAFRIWISRNHSTG